jgi:hypothetical protein
MMEQQQPQSFMQSVLSPNPASTMYASTVPAYQDQIQPSLQQHQQQQLQIPNGSGANVLAGSKRPYEDVIGDVNGHGQQHYQRQPPALNLDIPGRSTETPSRDDSHPRDGDSSTASPAGASDQYPKKKQKRNKPTLSCFECVERKTKACLSFISTPGMLLPSASITAHAAVKHDPSLPLLS